MAKHYCKCGVMFDWKKDMVRHVSRARDEWRRAKPLWVAKEFKAEHQEVEAEEYYRLGRRGRRQAMVEVIWVSLAVLSTALMAGGAAWVATM